MSENGRAFEFVAGWGSRPAGACVLPPLTPVAPGRRSRFIGLWPAAQEPHAGAPELDLVAMLEAHAPAAPAGHHERASGAHHPRAVRAVVVVNAEVAGPGIKE